jgi:TPR repeat protein
VKRPVAAIFFAVALSVHSPEARAGRLDAELERIGPPPTQAKGAVDFADRTARLERVRRELSARRAEALPALRTALARPREASPAGDAHQLRVATLLFELGGLAELKAIDAGTSGIPLGSMLSESFDLLAALGRTKDPRVLPLLARALARDGYGEQPVDLVAGGLADGDVGVEIIFAPFGAELCKLLPPLLRDAVKSTAGTAARLLGGARCSEARALLRTWMTSQGQPAAGRAMLALAEIGDAADRPIFMTATRETKGATSSWAARALREVGDAAAVARLVELVNQRDHFVASNAFDGLLRAPDAGVIQALVELRGHAPPAIEKADVDETLACLATEAGMSSDSLLAGGPKVIAEVAAAFARRRSQEREQRARANPMPAELPALLAKRAGILERHDATWRVDVRAVDDALVRASRKRAGLPDAYSTPGEVTDMLERRCRAGGARSCLRASRIIQMGDATQRVDGPKAAALDQRGCALGLDDACIDEVGLYEGGRGMLEDLPRATSMLHALCDRGVPRGCTLLGMYKALGKGEPPNTRGAYELCFSKAPDARWLEWCQTAARGIEGVPDDALRARLYRKACTLGDPAACERAATFEPR